MVSFSTLVLLNFFFFFTHFFFRVCDPAKFVFKLILSQTEATSSIHFLKWMNSRLGYVCFLSDSPCFSSYSQRSWVTWPHPDRATQRKCGMQASERSDRPILNGTGAGWQPAECCWGFKTILLMPPLHRPNTNTGSGVDIIDIWIHPPTISLLVFSPCVLTPSLGDVQQARSVSRQTSLLLFILPSCLVMEQLLG